MSLFRKFKRHFHTVRRSYFEAAHSGSLGFTISHKQGEGVNYQENAIDRDKTARFTALIYKFLDERSEVHYRKVLDLIKSDYPRVTRPEDFRAIEEGMLLIENGVIPFEMDGKQYTAKQMFEIVSRAGYFERDEEAVQVFASMQGSPFAERFFWYQFKSFAFDAFRLIHVIFNLVQGVENHEEYKELFVPEEPKLKKCIYCLTESGSFKSEEHIFPESLIGDEIYLPPGYVCDECNNGILSQLDKALIEFEPIALLRVQHTPYTKKGKFPRASFKNMDVEKTDPNVIRIKPKEKTAEPTNYETLEDGRVKFNLSWTGRKKLDWRLYARAVYKIALGLVAHDLGHEAALDPKYDAARAFILKNVPFPNSMMVTTKSVPHPQVRGYMDLGLGGTPFVIDIFGMMFFINLEEHPKMQMLNSSDEFIKALSTQYEFQLVPLDEESGRSNAAS